ncbi:MAG: ABC transporter ATP-binding protein [Paludibacteraceae bacterium]|nr:ABC transporter ATP-binding protein [Paludibacteraceae bacterium]
MNGKNEILLSAENLRVGYLLGKKEIKVCDGMNFELKRGELVALLGPNGAGKSTLLRTLSSSQQPLSGNVHYSGRLLKNISQRDLSRKISVVLTDHTQAGGLTVSELVSLGRQPYTGFFGRLKARDLRLVDEAINSVGLSFKSNSYMAELSDGERQKAMIAKALVQETDVLLLDEPAAFLDVASKLELMALLRQIAVERDCAVLFSSHDVEQALTLSDRLWLMSRDGLLCGCTEDMVLQGHLSDLFRSNNVRFDIGSGVYRLCSDTSASVSVKAQDLSLLFWAKNALLRNGYGITDGLAVEFAIDLKAKDCIEIKTKNSIVVCKSFEEMLETIREND